MLIPTHFFFFLVRKRLSLPSRLFIIAIIFIILQFLTPQFLFLFLFCNSSLHRRICRRNTSIIVAVAVAVAVAVVIRIGQDRAEPNSNLRLVDIVVRVNDVNEAWEEPPDGSVAATTTSVVDAIFTSLLFEEVPATARPRLSPSKAGETSALPGERLFLLAANF